MIWRCLAEKNAANTYGASVSAHSAQLKTNKCKKIHKMPWCANAYILVCLLKPHNIAVSRDRLYEDWPVGWKNMMRRVWWILKGLSVYHCDVWPYIAQSRWKLFIFLGCWCALDRQENKFETKVIIGTIFLTKWTPLLALHYTYK